ncbi:MAG: AAA family ATPase [Alphaproteobacteria bacterium]|nr:AAA family ATPase [Alphaproteobacteria bacterium]
MGPVGQDGTGRRPHVVVLGNEKGGSGKSTTAMHLVVGLLRAGHRVGTLDLDGRQRTLTRYVENRRAFTAEKGLPLPMPVATVVERSALPERAAAEADEAARFGAALAGLAPQADFIVIDCPGNDSFLARLGHSHADTLITPLNDSFIDLDLLARVNPDTFAILGPSLYSQMVWEQKLVRARRDRGSIDWIVTRNRLSNLDARNKQRVADVLGRLAQRIGFRLAPGFGERVIYRELFLSGLTLLDLREKGAGVDLTMSHLAARQEVHALLDAVALHKGRAVG